MLIDYKKVNIYQDERLILKDVDFQAETGEFVYLIGRVGSGKSSLLKTIYGELDIDSEDAEKAVVLDESMPNIKRSRIPALRKQMGIIFQDFQLLHDRSVAKNLKFVLQATGWTSKQKIERRIEEVLAQVGMTDKKNKMPSELSGGEQQRIAIARAVLKDAPILILDEATSNLDNKNEHLVQQALDRLMKGRTTLIIAHRLSTIAAVDTIITLKNGRVDEIGSPDELAKTNGIYAKLLELQKNPGVAGERLAAYDIAAEPKVDV